MGPGAGAAPVCPEPPSSSRQMPLWTFRSDRAGHTFLMAGLLLVMGTVTLGGVFVSMSMSEDNASRDQGQHIMDPVSRLVESFNQSAQSMVHAGETNTTLFLDRLDSLEQRVHIQASREGIYLTISLMDPPDPALWQTPGRCPSYDPHRSEGGVVIGHSVSTRQDAIVGAAFEVQATDGHQVVKFPYYVKLHDCLPTTQTAWFSDIWVVDGWVLNPEHGMKMNDNNDAMRLGELPKGELVFAVNATMDEDTMDAYGWENGKYASKNDGNRAHHPANALSDYFLFQMDLSDLPDYLTLEDVRLNLHAWEIDAPNDYLQARVIHNGTVMHTWFPDLNETEQVFTYDLPTSPSGKPYWSVPELSDLMVEFQIIEPEKKFDPNAFFYVQYVEFAFNYTAPVKYAFEAVFDWPLIPTLYDEHYIEIRYRFAEATADETFLLQIKSAGTWETRIDLAPTGGGWNAVSYLISPIEIEDGIVEMRIIDSVDDDRWLDDGDEIEIDYLMIRSVLLDP